MKYPDSRKSTQEALETFFDDEIKNIDEVSGDDLLARMVGDILYFNSLEEQQKIRLLDKIVEYIKKVKEKLDQIGKNWGVSAYSISVTTPGVITISLNFTIPKK